MSQNNLKLIRNTYLKVLFILHQNQFIMNSNKFLIGGIVGGVVFFALGYVFYGLLLKSFFADNGMSVDMEKMVWWALIVSNLAFGFLLAYILGKANASSMGGGATIGFVVGLLMGLSYDLMMYAMGGGMNFKGIAADVVTGAVLSAIAGAAIVWVGSMGKKAA